MHWRMETAHLEDPKPHLGRIRIDGKPGVRMLVDRVKRQDDTVGAEAEQLGLAGSAMNTIPQVSPAPPGLQTRPLASAFQASFAR